MKLLTIILIIIITVVLVILLLTVTNKKNESYRYNNIRYTTPNRENPYTKDGQPKTYDNNNWTDEFVYGITGDSGYHKTDMPGHATMMGSSDNRFVNVSKTRTNGVRKSLYNDLVGQYQIN